MKSYPFNRSRKFRKPEEPYQVNEKITAPEVRLVGKDVAASIYPTAQALAMAKAQGLDLVQVTDKSNPPVCQIVDYSKFKYERKKKEKFIKAQASKQVTKEIKLSLRTESHDIAFKKKHALKFIQDGAAVDVLVQIRFRELSQKDQGKVVLENFFNEIAPHGAVMKHPPTLQGRRYKMTIELDKKQKSKN